MYMVPRAPGDRILKLSPFGAPLLTQTRTPGLLGFWNTDRVEAEFIVALVLAYPAFSKV